MAGSVIGAMVASALAGALVAVVAAVGVVTVVSSPPDVADQATIVQYADA